jgi:Nucleotidyltransferase domain.
MDRELLTKIDRFLKNKIGYSIKNEELEVYLIGSFASQTYDKDSDIDLLITKSPSPIKTGKVYRDRIEYDSSNRDVHICVNYVDGVTEDEPRVNISFLDVEFLF